MKTEIKNGNRGVKRKRQESRKKRKKQTDGKTEGMKKEIRIPDNSEKPKNTESEGERSTVSADRITQNDSTSTPKQSAKESWRILMERMQSNGKSHHIKLNQRSEASGMNKSGRSYKPSKSTSRIRNKWGFVEDKVHAKANARLNNKITGYLKFPKRGMSESSANLDAGRSTDSTSVVNSLQPNLV